MSFRFNNTHEKTYKNNQKQKGKEKDSFLTHLSQINLISLSKGHLHSPLKEVSQWRLR